MIIITGATGAMGQAAAKEMLEHGLCVLGACRNTAKAQAWADQLPEDQRRRYRIEYLDLSEPESVDAFVAKIAAEGLPIDALFHNAGTMQRRYLANSQGIELTYATNYLGTRQLTEGILPHMAPHGAILFTSSLSCHISHPSRLARQPYGADRYRQMRAYADSKLTLTYYAQELAARRPDLRVNCTDPGVVDSPMLHLDRWFDRLADILFRPLCKTPSQGIIPAMRALESPLTNRLFRNVHDRPFSGRLLLRTKMAPKTDNHQN